MRLLAAVMSLCCLVVGAVVGAPYAVAAEPPSSTTPDSTVPPTTPSSTVPPTTTPGAAEPTTTTTPAAPPTTKPADSAAPADTHGEPPAADVAAARASFVTLTDDQRAILRRLQQAQSDLVTRRFALVVAASAMASAQDRLTRAQAAEREATVALDQASTQLARLRVEVRDLAGAMYRHLDHTAPLASVDTTDARALSRARTYAQAPEEALDARVAAAVALRAEVADRRERLAADRVQAARLANEVTAQLGAQEQALVAATSASAVAAAAVTEALGSGALVLGQVADPHFGADAITATLAVAQAGEDDPVTVLGAFRLPIPGARLLGSPYGMRVDPLSGNISYHPGVDFEAGAGTPIHAAAAGTVVMAGDCGGYGNCVVIDHGHSLATLYAHQRAVRVAVGEVVAEGQVVGEVGSTGRSTGPHLHFEVRLHGVPIDPMTTLTA